MAMSLKEHTTYLISAYMCLYLKDGQRLCDYHKSSVVFVFSNIAWFLKENVLGVEN